MKTFCGNFMNFPKEGTEEYGIIFYINKTVTFI